MSRFWYPYADFAEAQSRLCAFADETVGPDCGVSFSDGTQIAALRLPGAGPAGGKLWLNVLAEHISRPATTHAAHGDLFGSVEHWFERVMTIEGQAEIESAQAQLAAGQAIDHAIYEHAWLPAHDFLLRHKLAADTVGFALDVVGVIAGGVFVVTAFMPLATAGTGVALAGLASGTLATVGAGLLTWVDGNAYFAELAGNDAYARAYEDEPRHQWMRVAATAMLLPDVAIGGLRALKEIGKLGQEAGEASSLAAESRVRSAEARERAARVHHPDRHPGPINRKLHQANAFARAAVEQARAAEEATARLRMIAGRDVGLFQGGTLAGTALLTAAPPGVLLSDEQKRRDEKYQKSLAPGGGMPTDMRLSMRVTSHCEVAET